MCRAFSFHPIRRCRLDFVVRAFFNIAICGFLFTLVAWRILFGIALRVFAAVAIYCRCFVFNAHLCDTLKVARNATVLALEKRNSSVDNYA